MKIGKSIIGITAALCLFFVGWGVLLLLSFAKVQYASAAGSIPTAAIDLMKDNGYDAVVKHKKLKWIGEPDGNILFLRHGVDGIKNYIFFKLDDLGKIDAVGYYLEEKSASAHKKDIENEEALAREIKMKTYRLIGPEHGSASWVEFTGAASRKGP